MKLRVEETFCAAHRLPGAGKCANLHGHTYKVAVEVSGNLYGDSGWVMDFNELREIVRGQLPDHQLILWNLDPMVDALADNQQPILKLPQPPTAEHIALYLFEKISARIAGRGKGHLERVEVWESPTSSSIATRHHGGSSR